MVSHVSSKNQRYETKKQFSSFGKSKMSDKQISVYLLAEFEDNIGTCVRTSKVPEYKLHGYEC